ncbi:MAG: aerobic carbon-monoxide dehydrogenase small subunit [Solirubrobacteraceae bacterium]|jgi:carbon-monoxide dehydrogenase small subunit|nr:aerobic carbon-monoxide dehydrogenase small subunit [Solirubrobacteraceae bacterium]
MTDVRSTPVADPTLSRAVSVTANGRRYERTVPTRKTLADFIREDLGLTGTHLGCEHGVCGACTVRLDGEIVRSCLMLAVQCDGRTLQTIEGVAPGPDELSVVQEAFWEKHGLQCGFCTPGMVLTATDLLQRTPHPTEAEVREAMGGNLCRCTGYQFIVDAVLHAAEAGAGDGAAEEAT